MKSKLIMVVLLSTLVLPIAVHAVSNAAVIFLLIEPGSRAGGLGQAYTAQVDDAFAGYWNPGAMAFNRKRQIGTMLSKWLADVFDDIYYLHVTGNQYFDEIGNLGINLTYMSYGEQERTDDEGNSLGTFRSFDFASGLTYAHQASERLGVGITFKFIYSHLADEGQGSSETTIKGEGMSYAFDLGLKHKGVDFGQILVSPYNGVLALYNGIASLAGTQSAEYSRFSVPVNELDFGFNFQNIGPNITYINESQSDPLPMNWRMGFSYRAFEAPYSKLTVNFDWSKVLANDDPVFKRMFTAWTDDFNERVDEDGNKIDDFASFNNFINSIEVTEIIWNWGVEYVYMDLLALRAGYIWDRAGEIEGFSFGAGFNVTINNFLVNLDFAFQPGGELTKWNRTYSGKAEF